jgi:hypothetical protein
MTKQTLVCALQHAGHSPIQLEGADGASILILPYGARVLGLFPGTELNLLWANPALDSKNSATEFFATEGWRNTGGNRTWISPERDIHVRNLDDPWASYEVPESIDPGRFSVSNTEHQVHLSADGLLRNHRTGATCAVRLEKTIGLVPSPLRYDPAARTRFEDVHYAGYAQTTVLTVTEARDFRTGLSIWDAVNLPATGVMIIPTSHRAQVTDFFEPTGARYLRQSQHVVTFVFDGRQRHKIALRVSDLVAGRAGYLRPLSADQWTLVVRNFFIDPSAEYVDTPWLTPEDRGYALECYNDGGLNGAYGELEYHSQAIIGSSTSFIDHAQLWGFQGNKDDIIEIAVSLLGIRSINISKLI